MRRFFTLVALLLFALPAGLSVIGCRTDVGAYCNNAGFGPKTSDIYAVRLPASQAAVGISLAYGQIGQITTPVATNCKGSTLSTGAATFGSSNLNLVDVSTTGQICGGSWNRFSAGGIPDFTICTPSPTAGTATVTATIGGVVSNPVTVYVHPQISTISIPDPTGCVASGKQPDGNVTLASQTQVFDQDGTLIPSQGNSNQVGTVTYTPVTPSIVTINNTSVNVAANGSQDTTTPNGTATANQPGGTVISATIAGTGNNSAGTSSAAGYFYTCPPQSISMTLPNSSNAATNPSGAVTITAGNPQTLNTVFSDTVNDTTIVPIAGSAPDYTSTQPQQISVAAAGTVSSSFPATATITGICQPGQATTTTDTSTSASTAGTGNNCNPTPINKLGVFGTGLPITANPIYVKSTGVASTLLWAASPNSVVFTPFDLSQGTAGAPVRLPYTPNSMVLDPTGANLYFGSYRELMIYTANTNTLTKEDTTVPGVVLAVSPTNNQVVIADQLRKVIYLYTPSVTTPATTTGGQPSTTAASVISNAGLGNHAVFSPDGKNVYIIGPDTLYVHNAVSGWSTYPLTAPNPTASCTYDNNNLNPFCSPDITVTVPSVAVFTSGPSTQARSFCPDTTTAPTTYNPIADTVAGASIDHLAATLDGDHILGANATTLFDIQHTPSSTSDTSDLVAPIGACPGIATPAGPLTFQTSLQQLALTGITPTQINGVYTSPDSTKAFVTYTAAAGTGVLPVYVPSATLNTPGQLSNVQLTSGAQSPLTGVFSPDDLSFFVSTTGDNLIHVINNTNLTDTQQLNPQLVDTTGQAVPAQFLAAKPRPTT